jgi:glyoxylase-like metal-dependent hydrolase (beta-lactamase superfamily II)
MAVVRLTLGKRSVLFIADVVHHPIQFAIPDLGSNFCADSAQARTTRDRILADSFDGSTILAPYHFASPAFGCLSRENGGLRFSPLLQQGFVRDHANSQMAPSSGHVTQGNSR